MTDWLTDWLGKGHLNLTDLIDDYWRLFVTMLTIKTATSVIQILLIIKDPRAGLKGSPNIKAVVTEFWLIWQSVKRTWKATYNIRDQAVCIYQARR